MGGLLLAWGVGWALWAAQRRFAGVATTAAIVWQINRCWAILWYRVRRVGPCTVPAEGPVILTANHGSTADPLMLSATCTPRMMGFMVAREFAHLPILHHFTEMVGCIPVRRDGRDAAAVKAAMRRLGAGGMLGVFIEGRIPRPGECERPKDGVALMALRTGAVVVPAYISGLVYRDGVAASFFARHRARVRYGRPVDLREFTGHDRETVRRATARIHAAILELRRQAEQCGERARASAEPL